MLVDAIRYEFVSEIDINALIELYQAAGWWKEYPKTRANLPSLVKGSFCFLYVTDSGRPIGMGRVISDGVSDGYIQDVMVKAEYRNKGVGTEIVKRLRDHCLDHGLEWIGLVAEPGLTPFYESLSFEILADHTPMLLLR